MPYGFLDGKVGNNISIIGMDDDGPELAGDIRQGCRGERLFGSGAPPQDADLHCQRRIADLENQLGVCLLERSTRNTGDRSLPRRANHQDHAIVDGTCRPLAFCLSPGNVADITVAPALLASMPLSRQFLADQAYDARAFRQRLAERGALVL
jgi:hypothetical protein